MNLNFTHDLNFFNFFFFCASNFLKSNMGWGQWHAVREWVRHETHFSWQV